MKLKEITRLGLLIIGPSLFVLGGTHCTGETGTDLLCSGDSECTIPGTRCDVAINQCVCVNDEACADGSFCNQLGVCQIRSGCVVNSDCSDGSFCDITTGICLEGEPQIPGSLCGVASHCAFGNVCVNGVCEAGCFDDGDCVLGQICFQGECATGDGICTDDSFCDYGEICENLQCKPDRRGPYCRGCMQATGANPTPCDDPRNFCVINSQEQGGFRTFCGVDCSLNQGCPNGFNCNNVVILTDAVCTFNAQCKCDPRNISFATSTCTVADTCDPRGPDGLPDDNATGCTIAGAADCNGGTRGGPAACLVLKGANTGNCTCAANEDCDGESVCVDGVCCTGPVREERQCRVGEARTSGFCSCGTDDDCPQQSCNGATGACSITGTPCEPGAGDCGPVPCVNGGCLIGQNCAPEQGLSCSVVAGQ